MATETFSDFIQHLDKHGELARVKARVSPILEISEIADRMSKSKAPHDHKELDRNPAGNLGGKALLFENVEGSDIPVAINTFGSYWRVNEALGTQNLEALAARVQHLVKPEMPTTLIEKMKKLPELIKLGSFPPKIVRSGICQQVVLEGDRADLTRLPIIQCWPLDGDLTSGQISDHAEHARKNGVDEKGTGRYVTLGGIHTRNPITGDRNIGMYRVQLFGPRKCAMHWHVHHDGARHFRLWKQRGEKMPLAVVLGGESVLPYAATAPLPPGIEEHLFAGFLNDGGIPLVQCRPTTRSSSRATSIPMRSSSKAPSATTPAIIHSPTGIPCSTSPPSPIAKTRFTRPRSSASRRWKTTSSAKPPSGFFCRF
jgi:4-hydroxy-3-polyprenylbenzoate decarboxylase